MAFNPRLARLHTDHDRLTSLEKRNQAVKILEKPGNPPQEYVLLLRCKSVVGITSQDEPIYSHEHKLKITLPVEYPREPPQFKMLTPIWHPNIGFSSNSPTSVCIGDEGNHGYSPSMGLDDLVTRIVEMLQYRNYGIQRPLNSIAAGWAERHLRLFPLDR